VLAADRSTGGSLPVQTYREDASGELVAAKNTPLYAVVHDSPNADQTPLDYWEFVFDLDALPRQPLCPQAEAWRRHAHRSRSGAARHHGGPPPPRRQDRLSLEPERQELGPDRGRCLPRPRLRRRPARRPVDDQLSRQSLGIAIAADQTAGALFANGARPSGTLKFKEWLDQDKRDEARADIRRSSPAPSTRASPFILEGGSATWQQISLNADDAQLLQSRGWSVEDICRWFGVPPFMIGHNEKTTSWGTGIEQMTLGFVKFTLSPYLIRIEQAIRKQLLTPAERAQGIVAEVQPRRAAARRQRRARPILRRDDPDRRDDPQRMPAEGKPAAGSRRRRGDDPVAICPAARGDPGGAQRRHQCCSTSSIARRR
jgi:hypothetical protein